MAYDLKPRIVVFGVGGAGGNAVDNMIEAGLQGVEFVVANTDAQALARSKAATRIQLGPKTTAGLGAGARPDIGAKAAEESVEDIRAAMMGAHMVFIAAGMGGGTGTGAAPVIARVASESGVLTVAVVTKPFGFEGTRRMNHAEEGLDAIRGYVDTMIVVPNQNLFRVANERTTFAEAFRLADDVLYSGVRGITDLMVMPGLINLDFADVNVIMRGMGTAMMGMGEASGERRAYEAARLAIDNPLLDEISMRGAKGVLINITGGYDMTLFELDEAANEVRREVDPDANIILGSAFDTSLEGRIRVSVVAAGVDSKLARDAAPKVVVSPAVSVPTPVVIEEEAEEEIELEEEIVDEGEDDFDQSDEDYEVEIDAEEDADEEEFEEEEVEAVVVDDDRPRVVMPARNEPPSRFQSAVPAAPPVSEPVRAAEPKYEPTPEPKPEPKKSRAGFSNLFGWRKGERGANDDAPAPIVSTPEDHPDAAPFDDKDLEIPAFLRRSANH